MTDDNLNLCLNVASLPRQRQKAKSVKPQEILVKPKAKQKPFHIDAGRVKDPLPSKGILDKTASVPSKSIWKTFKEVNRTSTKTIVPVFKKKNLEVKNQKKPGKNVTFTTSEPDICLNSDAKSFNSDNDYNEVEDMDEHVKKKKKKKERKSFIEGGEGSCEFPTKNGYKLGKSSSLFGNNPRIPQVPHKAVKPLKEPVFSKISFSDVNLHPYMVKYLSESMGLTVMTTVQQKSIPILLEKKDALIRSQTGSGKTLAFVLPILHHLQEIRPKINRTDGVMVLIVVPTRELALQTYEVFNKLVKSYTWIVPGYLVGGEKRKSEKARLRKGISILIGTPGRLVDHLQNTSCLSLEKVTWLVLDEADRLFDMGYEKDVSSIIATLDKGKTSLLSPDYLNPDSAKANTKEEQEKRERHTVLLSATLTPKVMQLAGLSLTDPVFVDACDDTRTTVCDVPIFNEAEETEEMVALPENLVQKYIVVPAKLRLVVLSSLILWKCKLSNEKKMLVFIATQDMVDYYAELLSTALSVPGQDDSDADDSSRTVSTSGIEFFKLHGSMGQKERTEVFNTFRKAESGVLFCTDVAARGLDLPEVDWVVQFTGPTSIPDYVHRVGRTARGGQPGSSIIFLLPSEVEFIAELENRRIRLSEEKLDKCLRQLWTFYPESPTAEEAASGLQSSFEEVVLEQAKMRDMACKAYSSWSRFYACYPRNMKRSFNIKSVHQGHYAKSFALRETPSAVISYARGRRLNDKRLPTSSSQMQRPRDWRHADRKSKPGLNHLKRSRASEVSEFDSGLEPLRKKAK